MNWEQLLELYQKIKDKFPSLTNSEIFEIIKIKFLSDIARKIK